MSMNLTAYAKLMLIRNLDSKLKSIYLENLMSHPSIMDATHIIIHVVI